MKAFVYWILAILITFLAIIYQRTTGPTYDKRVKTAIDGIEYNFKLVRSHGGEDDCKIEFAIEDQGVSGVMEYRKYPTNFDWVEVKMVRNQNILEGTLPHLPPAGKYEYKIILEKNGKKYPLNEGQPVIIRFKGAVPGGVLIPHIFFMFFAMLLANLAGIMAIFRYRKFRFYTNVTLITLFTGGLILGPWVQWYAFGEVWAGIPFAWDLTDNKTLIAFLFWLLAFFMNRKKERPVYTIIASVVMLVVYSIPHSMFGSELNSETGEIIQGMIHVFI